MLFSRDHDCYHSSSCASHNQHCNVILNGKCPIGQDIQRSGDPWTSWFHVAKHDALYSHSSCGLWQHPCSHLSQHVLLQIELPKNCTAYKEYTGFALESCEKPCILTGETFCEGTHVCMHAPTFSWNKLCGQLFWKDKCTRACSDSLDCYALKIF